MVVLDTNILIDHFRAIAHGGSSLFETLLTKISPRELAISIISIQEFFTGKSMRNKKNYDQILFLLQKFTVLPYSLKIALLAGEISRESAVDMGFADAAIAATCLANDARLYSLNVKHFKTIKRIQLLDL